MKELVTCTQMKNLDEYTIEKMGIPSCVLMERAALCTVEEMKKRMKAGKETEKSLLSAEAETTAETVLLLQDFFIWTDGRFLFFFWEKKRL